MEKQELLIAWTELQTRVERSTALHLDMLQDAKTKSVRSRTRRSPIWDLLWASIGAVLIGNFAADNIKALLDNPVTALPAIAVFAFAIFLINVSIRQLIASSELDYSEPILETQAKLATLRKLRIQANQGTFIAALPLWVLFPILIGQMIIHPNFILALNPAWIAANVAFGVAMIPLVDWFMKKSRYSGGIMDSFVGKDVLEAEEFVNVMSKFRAD